MSYPTRKRFVITVKDDSNQTVLTLWRIEFDQPFAYEVIDQSSRFGSESYSDWLQEFIDKHFIVEPPKYKRSWWMTKWYFKRFVERSNKLYRMYCLAFIFKNAGWVIDSIHNCYFLRKESIFKGIEYPTIKWQPKRNRDVTFVESLVWCCNWDPSKVDNFLKTHTYEQIDVLMDAKSLINNESVKEFRWVNDSAVLNIDIGWGRKKIDEVKDTFDDIRARVDKMRADKKK